MDVTQHEQSGPPPPPAASLRPRNGLGVAALVIGVANLVAAVSFVLFPLALLGGLVGLIRGIIALTRGSNRGATNTGQAIAGVVCCALALVIALVCGWARVGRQQLRRVRPVQQVHRPGGQQGRCLDMHRPLRQRRPALVGRFEGLSGGHETAGCETMELIGWAAAWAAMAE
jgi:hypothetical protein